MTRMDRTTKIASKSTKDAIDEYRAAKVEQDKANARVDAAKVAVSLAFAAQGNPDRFTGNRGKTLITRTEVTRTSLDAATVKRYAPKTYERALRTSTFPRLTLGR